MVHTIIFNFHPAIHLHANIPFHSCNFYESNNADFITISNQVTNHLSARQYPKHIIESNNADFITISNQVTNHLSACQYPKHIIESNNADFITISNQVTNHLSARQYPKYIIESNNADFITISNQVTNHLSARQYPNHIIESTNDNLHSILPVDILKLSSKKIFMDHIPLILPLNPSIYPLCHNILKHCKTPMTDQTTNDILKSLLITCSSHCLVLIAYYLLLTLLHG